MQCQTSRARLINRNCGDLKHSVVVVAVVIAIVVAPGIGDIVAEPQLEPIRHEKRNNN